MIQKYNNFHFSISNERRLVYAIKRLPQEGVEIKVKPKTKKERAKSLRARFNEIRRYILSKAKKKGISKLRSKDIKKYFGGSYKLRNKFLRYRTRSGKYNEKKRKIEKRRGVYESVASLERKALPVIERLEQIIRKIEGVKEKTLKKLRLRAPSKLEKKEKEVEVEVSEKQAREWGKEYHREQIDIKITEIVKLLKKAEKYGEVRIFWEMGKRRNMYSIRRVPDYINKRQYKYRLFDNKGPISGLSSRQSISGIKYELKKWMREKNLGLPDSYFSTSPRNIPQIVERFSKAKKENFKRAKAGIKNILIYNQTVDFEKIDNPDTRKKLREHLATISRLFKGENKQNLTLMKFSVANGSRVEVVINPSTSVTLKEKPMNKKEQKWVLTYKNLNYKKVIKEKLGSKEFKRFQTAVNSVTGIMKKLEIDTLAKLNHLKKIPKFRGYLQTISNIFKKVGIKGEILTTRIELKNKIAGTIDTFITSLSVDSKGEFHVTKKVIG